MQSVCRPVIAPPTLRTPDPAPLTTRRRYSIRHQVAMTIPANVTEEDEEPGEDVTSPRGGVNDRGVLRPTEDKPLEGETGDSDVTGYTSDCDVDESGSDEEAGEQHDLQDLKVTAVRLKLMTRRPSYVDWQQQVALRSLPQAVTMETEPSAPPAAVKPFQERKTEIDSSIGWLKHELADMQTCDYTIARKLMRLRTEIHRMRIRMWTQEHREMLEEAEEAAGAGDELDELYELHCDEPARTNRGRDTLRHIGLTNMNFHARRYSIM